MDINNIIDNRIIKIKYIIKVYNKEYTEIDDISRYLVGAPNFSITADNEVRRSCDFNIVASKKFDSDWIWTNKILSIGINMYKDFENNVCEYENLGYYVISTVSETDSLESHTIHLSCVDFMGLLNGTVNGTMLGNGADEYIIKAGSGSIQDIITQIIKDSGIYEEWQYNKIIVPSIYIITDSQVNDKIPYDISVSVGSTYYDLLKEIMNITPNMQMFFDKQGNFIVTPIPNGIYEPIAITNEQFKKIIIGYERSLDYGSIKNVIEIYGEIYNSDICYSVVYATNSGGDAYDNTNPSSGNIAYIVNDTETFKEAFDDKQNDSMIISVTKTENILVGGVEKSLTRFTYDTIVVLDNVTKAGKYADEHDTILDDELYYTATNIKEIPLSTPDSLGNTGLDKFDRITTINIEFNEFPNVNGITYKYSYDTDEVPSDCYLCNFRYQNLNNDNINQSNMENLKSIVFLAYQPYCKIEETNTDSPYHKNNIGVRRIVLTGGEYDNIYCQSLANDRAKYELYNLCRINDSISVECIALYGIDVNQIVELVLDSKVLGENDTTNNLFIIKGITYNELTMTLTLTRYYPELENVI